MGHLKLHACDLDRSPQAAAIETSRNLRTPFRANMVCFRISPGQLALISRMCCRTSAAMRRRHVRKGMHELTVYVITQQAFHRQSVCGGMCEADASCDSCAGKALTKDCGNTKGNASQERQEGAQLPRRAQGAHTGQAAAARHCPGAALCCPGAHRTRGFQSLLWPGALRRGRQGPLKLLWWRELRVRPCRVPSGRSCCSTDGTVRCGNRTHPNAIPTWKPPYMRTSSRSF